jgi:hypothetical protein
MVMSLDDVLFGVIVGGVGLCAVYFRDEYIGWRKDSTAEMRKETSTRELYIDRFSNREDADSIRSAVNLEKIADTESGRTEDSTNGQAGAESSPALKRNYSRPVPRVSG